jgi:hypothetical protein
MKKLILITAVLMLTTSCGKINRMISGFTGEGVEECHKGVTYLQFTSGSVTAVDRQGKPLPCNK